MSLLTRRASLATFGAALIAAVLIGATSAQAESNGGVRVMPLGDSITDGYTVPGGYRIGLWQQAVGAGYKVDFVGSQFNGPSSLGDHDHEGHSGWTISQIDAQVVTWLRNSAPRTVLLHIGTNDMYGDTSGAPARLGTLLDHITSAAPDADVFVATIIPSTGRDNLIRAYNAAIPGLVQTRANAGKHVHLVSMYDALTTSDLADGIHPNAGGYQKMANVWFAALQSVPGSIGNGPSTPPATTPPAAAGCTASYRLVNSWGNGLQGEVTVKNATAAGLSGWTVRLSLPSGESVASIWGGVNSGTTGSVDVRNADYNGQIAGNGSTTFGFVLNGSTGAPAVTSCTSTG